MKGALTIYVILRKNEDKLKMILKIMILKEKENI